MTTYTKNQTDPPAMTTYTKNQTDPLWSPAVSGDQLTREPLRDSGLVSRSDDRGVGSGRGRRRTLSQRGGSASSCSLTMLRTDLSAQESSARAAVQGYQSTLGDLERASLLARQAVGVLEDGVTATSKLFNTLAEAITEADRQFAGNVRTLSEQVRELRYQVSQIKEAICPRRGVITNHTPFMGLKTLAQGQDQAQIALSLAISLGEKVLRGEAGDADIRKLSSALDVVSANPSASAKLVDQLGALGVARLLDKAAFLADGFGEIVAGSLREDAFGLAFNIRNLVSVATNYSGWEGGGRFGREIVKVNASMWGCGTVVGFLFLNPDVHPMGEAFTVGVADWLDLHERQGELWLPNPGVQRAASLGRAEFGDAGFIRQIDLPARVFQTLGEVHPARALDWLKDGQTAGPFPRIDYWFGQRDWAFTGDGFEGPSSLWAGLQGHPGGLAAGGTDEGVLRQLAVVNTHISAALAANPWFRPENLIDSASFRMAETIYFMMPHLLRYPITSQDALFGDYVTQSIFGSEGEFPIPNINRYDLAVLMGVTVSNNTSRDFINDRLLDMWIRADAMGLTVADDKTNMYVFSRAKGWVQGSRDGALTAVAERTRNDRVSLLETGISATLAVGANVVAAKFTGGASKPAKPAINAAVKEATSWVFDLVRPPCPVEAQREASRVEAADIRGLIRAQNPDGPHSPRANEDASAFNESVRVGKVLYDNARAGTRLLGPGVE